METSSLPADPLHDLTGRVDAVVADRHATAAYAGCGCWRDAGRRERG